MKKATKIMVVMLALAMTLGMFAGCGSDESDEMVIGMTLFAPMNYYEGEELIGFETEFAKAVCEKIGKKAKFQVIDWNSKENELNGNTIDCVWNGMTITNERKENMLISIPYMQNKQVAVVRAEDAEKFANLDNLAGVSIVAEKGSAGEGVAKEDATFSKAKYTAVDTQAKALMEIKAKTADIAIVDYVMSIGSIGEGTDYADLVVVNKDFAPEQYGIAFKKGNTELCDKVNQAIKDLAKEGKLEEIAKKYKLQDLIIVK